jgi:CheY-like chemotaxis protein/HPt (histidine-containing phosphotransfer) domain-containing protein
VNQRVAQRLLDMHGLEVTAVNDGREAVGRLERDQYDLVLMDCLMPVMDGYMATRLWRERESASGSGHLPIVAMTANAMAGDRERCLASGMDDYLSKPLDRAALAQTLRRWLPKTDAQNAPPVVAAPAPVADVAPVVPRAPVPSQPKMTRSDSPRITALDAVVISDLLDTMGGEFGDLVRVYLEDAPLRLREIETAAQGGDSAAQVGPAHTLKSSSANIGATGLSDFAKGIEHAARVGVVTTPAEIAAGMRPEYERVAIELNALLDRGKP